MTVSPPAPLFSPRTPRPTIFCACADDFSRLAAEKNRYYTATNHTNMMTPIRLSVLVGTLPCAVAQGAEGSIFDESWAIVSMVFLSMLMAILCFRGCSQVISLDCRREQVRDAPDADLHI